MSHQSSFNQIKNTMLRLLDHPAIADDVFFNATENINYDIIYKERIDKLFASFDDIANAIELNDRLEINRALSRAKLRAMSLTSFFTALEDDCISLLSRDPAPSPMRAASDTDGIVAGMAPHSALPIR